MVEFALVLPILILLLVMAIDFGRAFFGWVGLQNVARIGADYAAQYPDADWSDSGNARVQEYVARVLADAAAINCDLDDPLPPPTFPNGTEVGDTAEVTLRCAFTPLTPLVGGLLGSPIDMRADAVFPIRKGFVGVPTGGGGEPPPPPPCALVPDMAGGTVAEARAAWSGRGFTGPFIPATGFDDDTVTSQVTTPSSTPESDCIPLTSSVSVESVTAEGCVSGEFRIPLLTSQTVGEARDDWDASSFSGGFSPSGQNNAWAIDQSPAAGECQPEATDMTITTGPTPTPTPCLAPDFVGKSTTEAPGLWSGANFTGTITYQGSTPFVVQRQSLVAGQAYDCTAGVRLRP